MFKTPQVFSNFCCILECWLSTFSHGSMMLGIKRNSQSKEKALVEKKKKTLMHLNEKDCLLEQTLETGPLSIFTTE